MIVIRSQKENSPSDGRTGRFSGRYRRDGHTFTRCSDGREVIVCDTGREPDSPRRSRYFLVDGSSSGRDRIGYLYAPEGEWEFDDRVHRYRIVPLGGDRYRFKVLYRKGSSSASRGPVRRR